MSGSDSQGSAEDREVVEGAAASEADGSDAAMENGTSDNQGARLSSAVPDESDVSATTPKKGRKKSKAKPSTDKEPDEVPPSLDEAIDPELVAEVSDVSVEGLIADLERVTEEKDQYLDTSRRLQADFENYRRRVAKETSDARARGKEAVISEVLNVLDACDGAVANGAADVEPIRGALLAALGSQGMERIDPIDEAFDPEIHQAVMHDEAEDDNGPTVAEVMRAGYKLGGRVIRPAMVRVRG